MDLTIVTVSEGERARGQLNPETRMAAHNALHEAGTLILRGVFLPGGIDALYREFAARYGNLDFASMTALAQQPAPNPILQVGDGRFEIALRMTGGFGNPGLFANSLLTNFLGPLMGGELMRLNSFTAIASFPGAAMQHVHRDHYQLFEEFAQIGPALPLYAVNVSVPLIDIDQTMGPTGIWPGSHRSASIDPEPGGMVSIPLLRGDCLLIDYRTLHAGLPNNSQTVRPILYLVYTREWFSDDCNHRFRVPLDIPLEDIGALPEKYHRLLLRAYQNGVRARQLARP
jgi:hypothetical protein